MSCGWHTDATRYAICNPGRFGCELTPAGVTRYYTVYGHLWQSVTIRCDLYGVPGGGRTKRFEVGGIRFNHEGARNAFDYARALVNGQTPEAIRALWGLLGEASR